MRVARRLAETTNDRDWLLDAFARGLAPGDHILQLVDTYPTRGRLTLQLPVDATAEVLFIEPPRVQPGGITEILSYVRARDRSVRQVTVVEGRVEQDLEILLRPERSWASLWTD